MEEQIIPKKQCTGPCGQEYDATLEYWSPNKRGKHGFQSRCRTCVKEYNNRPEVKERKRVRMKKYHSRPEVKEHKRAYQRTRLGSHEGREQRKSYYSRPEVQRRVRSWRKDHSKRPEVQDHRQSVYRAYYSRPEVKEHIKAWGKDYHSRPEVKEHKRSYRSSPEVKELERVRSHNRRARIRSVKGTHSPQQIQEQLRRQKRKCYYCQKRFQKVNGKHIYHIDHTFPISRVAGSDIPANSIDYLVLACPSCNISKKDKFPWEWTDGGRLL